MDLTATHKEIVKKILQQFFSSETQAFIFGSRVKESNRLSSDLDLLLKSTEKISLSVVGLLREQFEDSNLPFKVDIVDFHCLEKNTQEQFLLGAVQIFP